MQPLWYSYKPSQRWSIFIILNKSMRLLKFLVTNFWFFRKLYITLLIYLSLTIFWDSLIFPLKEFIFVMCPWISFLFAIFSAFFFFLVSIYYLKMRNNQSLLAGFLLSLHNSFIKQKHFFFHPMFKVLSVIKTPERVNCLMNWQSQWKMRGPAESWQDFKY